MVMRPKQRRERVSTPRPRYVDNETFLDSLTHLQALLDMETESDRLVVCQAALLFISWSSNNDLKDGLHWTGVALTQAYSIGLQKSALASTAAPDRRLKRRIWWTIVMKEADVCLSMGKPPRILPFDIPMLDCHDFENKIGHVNDN